jgi:Pvc16 N-terminal domain
VLDTSLHFIKDYIGKQFTAHGVIAPPNVVVASIPKDLDTVSAEKIYVTLVNIEEEKIFKSQAEYKPLASNPSVIGLMNPEIRLNLYVLISAIFKSPEDRYVQSLKFLSQIITFFQGKNVFEDTDFTQAEKDAGMEKIIMELQSLSMDQINQMWQILGSKLAPGVLYKVRIVVMRDALAKEVSRTAEIKSIGIDIQRK